VLPGTSAVERWADALGIRTGAGDTAQTWVIPLDAVREVVPSANDRPLDPESRNDRVSESGPPRVRWDPDLSSDLEHLQHMVPEELGRVRVESAQ
jgi:hypothetical protein